MRSALVVVALGLALVLAEVVVRRFDLFGISYYKDVNRYFNEAIRLVPDAVHEQGRVFENKPGLDLSFVRFDFRTNDYGLRSTASNEPLRVARVEPPERGRLLFLGDSVTLAWGVNDEDSWIRTIEREGHDRAGRALECLNAGHLSYDSVQEKDWLVAHGPILQPDAVVLTYVVNDFESTWELYKDFLEGGEGIQRPELTWRDAWRARLITWFRGLYGVWHLVEERRGLREGDGRAVVVQEEELFIEGWPRSERALNELHAECVRLGVPLVVFDHTTPRVASVRAWCDAMKVPWFEFTFTPAEEAQGVRNSLADAHANELGQRFLADKALAALREIGILAP